MFTWGWENAPLPVSPGQSTVEITLEPDGAATRLRLVHRGLPADMEGFHRRGWNYALPRLGVVSEGGDPGPDPLRSILRTTHMAAASLPARYLLRFAIRRVRALSRRTENRSPAG